LGQNHLYFSLGEEWAALPSFPNPIERIQNEYLIPLSAIPDKWLTVAHLLKGGHLFINHHYHQL
jgi:hypothetical protein